MCWTRHGPLRAIPEPSFRTVSGGGGHSGVGGSAQRTRRQGRWWRRGRGSRRDLDARRARDARAIRQSAAASSDKDRNETDRKPSHPSHLTRPAITVACRSIRVNQPNNRLPSVVFRRPPPAQTPTEAPSHSPTHFRVLADTVDP